jgi:hypothetical protein
LIGGRSQIRDVEVKACLRTCTTVVVQRGSLATYTIF